MKTSYIYARTIKHAEYVLEYYSIDFNGVITCPPMKGSYGQWSIVYWAKHKEHQNWRASISLLLYPTIIKMLFNKYGNKVEKVLVDVATRSKDKTLIKHIWGFISEESRQNIMTNILGGKIKEL